MEQPNWHDKAEVKKGDKGEEIVTDMLDKQGYIIYKPITDGAHVIDRFSCKKNQIWELSAVEIKTKKRMWKYEKTGFDINAYYNYTNLKERNNMDTHVYFVDDFEEYIYSAWLSQLTGATEIGSVIVWDLSQMKIERKLTEDELKEIRQNSKKDKYDYSNIKKYFGDISFT